MPSNDILSLSISKDYLRSLGGDDALKLVSYCNGSKKSITDEEIKKKLKHLKVTEIRTLLNKLHFQGIANYQKTRDKRSGWYSYTWEIKNKRIAQLILEEQGRNLEKLEKLASFEAGHEFFSCKNSCDNVVFEIAAEYNFKCPECNENMSIVEKEIKVKEIAKQINVITKELEILKKKHK